MTQPAERPPSRALRISLLSLAAAAGLFAVPYVAGRFEIGLGIQVVAIFAWGLTGAAILISLVTGTVAAVRRRIALLWVIPMWIALVTGLIHLVNEMGY